MSEYAVVDRGSVVVIEKSISLDDAALFGCAVNDRSRGCNKHS